jgi:hypothetical protein
VACVAGLLAAGPAIVANAIVETQSGYDHIGSQAENAFPGFKPEERNHVDHTDGLIAVGVAVGAAVGIARRPRPEEIGTPILPGIARE